VEAGTTQFPRHIGAFMMIQGIERTRGRRYSGNSIFNGILLATVFMVYSKSITDLNRDLRHIAHLFARALYEGKRT
jgi:hypothetical protein